MHIDLQSERDAPARLHADVAVVGAGAAGLTLCRRLLRDGLSVALIESGGFDYEEATAGLNAGEIVGRDYYELEHARLRFFGGTTAIWGGRCAELDPIDFEQRSWVPHSGWPFGHDDIAPYYREAREALDLPAQAPHPRQAAALLARFSPTELATPLWSFDTRSDRFSARRSRDLLSHERCVVLTRATVREIMTPDDGASVTHLDVRSLTGRQLSVSARAYVLAAGGIENPRLLLASRSVAPHGIGNRHDQVGRYFMEHPHARGGRIVGHAAWPLLAAFQKRRVEGVPVAASLTPSAELQARAGLLNTSLTIAPRRAADAKEALLMRAYLHAKHRADPTSSGRLLWRTVKSAVGAAQRVTDPLRPWLLHKAGRLDVALLVRGEQAPNPASRVMLSAEQDALGMPRVALDWRTSPLDVDSVAGLVAALGREINRLGLGRVEAAPWLSDSDREWQTDSLISAHPIGGYHHIGTTRMADDPRRGVTDGFGRVHGVANLFVAGSSLFPTSGWANPTLTLIALAMRTADRITAELRQGETMATATRRAASPAPEIRPAEAA